MSTWWVDEGGNTTRVEREWVRVTIVVNKGGKGHISAQHGAAKAVEKDF
jgi:hypothetical protein